VEDVPDSGRTSPQPFAKYDPVTCSWKTWQASGKGASTSYRGTWPAAGMTLNGYAYALPPLALRTTDSDGSELPHLPTPTAADDIRGPDYARATRPGSGGDDLVTALARLGGDGWGRYAPVIERWEGVTRRAAPRPITLGPRGGKRVSPRFTEWTMGLPGAWVTGIRRIGVEDALRAIGNSVVPLQAYRAYRYLTRKRKS